MFDEEMGSTCTPGRAIKHARRGQRKATRPARRCPSYLIQWYRQVYCLTVRTDRSWFKS